MFLFDFMLSKLEEGIAMETLLGTLIFMIKSVDILGEEWSTKKLQATLIEKFNVPSEPQGVRKLFYELFLLMLELPAFILGEDLFGFMIDSFENEKDPRNLVLSLKILTLIGKNFPHQCELFSSVSVEGDCYK